MEVTASEAAQRYGVFPHVLYRMILMRRLEARKDANGHWLISKDSLDRWNRERVRRTQRTKTNEGRRVRE